MHNHATFLLEIISLPKVVIATEKVHFHTHVGQFADFSEQTRVALGHHIAILKPEIEDVAHEIYGLGLMLDAFEKIDQPALLCPGMRYRPAAEMGI